MRRLKVTKPSTSAHGAPHVPALISSRRVTSAGSEAEEERKLVEEVECWHRQCKKLALRWRAA